MNRLAIILILILSCVAMRSLWIAKGFPKTHDSLPHMARILNMKEALDDGQIPPLWGARMMGGIGSPAMMLNYQLPYYPIMGLMYLGVRPELAYREVLIVTYILSGLFMYWALTRKYQSWPALIGTLLYILATYRFVDIYVRGALGECVAFMFPPLILGSYWSKRYTLLVVGLAGLFLSHPVGSLLFSLYFGGMLLLDLKKSGKWGELWKYAGLYLIAIGISAYNIIPTLALTKYTHYTPADSATLYQFPTIKQLFHSDWGYGVSTIDDKDGMSFAIGYGQWTAIVFAILMLVISFGRRDKDWTEGAYAVGGIIVAIFLMLAISTPIYKILHLTSVIDYPWRILMLVVFAVSMAAVWTLSHIRDHKVRIVAGMVVAMIALYANRNHCRVDDIWRIPMRNYFIETGDAYGEYAAKTRVTRNMSSYPSRATLTGGEAKVEVITDKSNRLEVVTTGSVLHKLRLNIMAFPGWEVVVNGVKTNNCSVTPKSNAIMDDSGLIECELPAGNNRVVAHYSPLPIQIISNIITVLSIGGLFIWNALALFSRHTTKNKR